MKKTNASSARADRARARMPVVCPPEAQGNGFLLRLCGWFCRAFVLFWAVLGLALFVCDAFRLTDAQNGLLSPSTLVLDAALAVLFFAVPSLLRCGWVAPLLLAGGGLAACLLLPARFFSTALRVTCNTCLGRLIDLGYYGLTPYVREVPPGRFSAGTYVHVTVGLFILLLAAIFVPCLIGRVRMALPAVVSGAIIAFIFIYNLSRTNWGFALIVSSFAAILVLAAYDRCYLSPARGSDPAAAAHLFPPDPGRPRVAPMPPHMAARKTTEDELHDYLQAPDRAGRHRQTRAYHASLRAVRHDAAIRRQTRIAVGGFAGIAVLLLSMLILFIPAACTRNNFAVIDLIDRPMDFARRYVTACLMGDNPILDELGYGGNVSNFAPHTTDVEPRNFTGETIFEVETMYNTNLYLRGWVATDYRDGLWYTGADDVLAQYRAVFGTEFHPEILRVNFYTYTDPSVTTYTDYVSRVQDFSRYGFVTMQVNLRRVGGSSNLVFLPAYINPRIGLVDYASGEASKLSYVNYFDGIYTGRRFQTGASYGAVAFATTMRDQKFMETLSRDIAAFNLARLAMTEWLGREHGEAPAFGTTEMDQLSGGVGIYTIYGEKGYTAVLVPAGKDVGKTVRAMRIKADGDDADLSLLPPFIALPQGC